MTETEVKEKQMQTEKEIADADRAFKEKDSKRKFVSNLIGAGIGAATGLATGGAKVGVDFAKYKMARERAIKKGEINGPEWYKTVPGLDEVNTSLPDYFPQDQDDLGEPEVVKGADYSQLNSVVCVEYIPTIGIETEKGSTTIRSGVNNAINESLARFITQVSKNNSRNLSYSRDTVGRYVIGVTDGIIVPLKLIKSAVDVYDIANASQPRVAKKIITALGFNYRDFMAHIADYKVLLLSQQSLYNESIPLPKNFSFVSRRYLMAGLMLRDRDSKSATIAVFKPTHIAYVDGNSDIIHYRELVHMTYDVLFNILTETYETFTNGATWKPLIRDMNSGLKEESRSKLTFDFNNSSTEIYYSDEMLMQLQNADMVPMIKFGRCAVNNTIIRGSLDIYGDDKERICQGFSTSKTSHGVTVSAGSGPIIIQSFDNGNATQSNWDLIKSCITSYDASRTTQWYSSKLLNFYKKPSGDDVLVGTRLSARFRMTHCTPYVTTGQDADKFLDYPVSFGSNKEVVVNVTSIAMCGTEVLYRMFDVSNSYSDKSSVNIESIASSYYTRFVDIIFGESGVAEPGWGFTFSNRMGCISVMTDNDEQEFSEMGIETLGGIPTVLEPFYQYSIMSRLDWLPLTHIHYSYYDAGSATDLANHVLGELDTSFVVSPRELSRINKQCIQSEFFLDNTDFKYKLE